MTSSNNIVDPMAQSIGSAAQEALILIYKNRRQDYNDPVIEFEKIAKVWSAILGQSITKEQYCLCMIAVKLIRESGKHKRDNIVDMIGYAQLLDDLRSRV